MSMLLKGDNENEFELALVQDRFAEQQDGFGDSRFVTVSFRVATSQETWEETAPVMNLFQLENLVEWLRAVAHGSPEVSEVELLEPGLRFMVLRNSANGVTLRVGFHLEDRPEELVIDAPTDEARHVDIRVSREQVGAAAAELGRDLRAALKAPQTQSPEEDLGIFGAPDSDLNLLADEDAAEFPQLADAHDDIAELAERELREIEGRKD
jgi:hypothetical protein